MQAWRLVAMDEGASVLRRKSPRETRAFPPESPIGLSFATIPRSFSCSMFLALESFQSRRRWCLGALPNIIFGSARVKPIS